MTKRYNTATLITMQSLPIGILSGTFDPIHLGHMHLANTMYKLGNLQKILFIPCLQSPLRGQPIANASDRLNMVKLAIGNLDYFVADDREINRPGPSYTIETLKSLRLQYKNTPLALIMGIDAFNRFDEWQDAQQILELAHILIANRPEFQLVTNKKINSLLQQRQTNDIKQLQKNSSGLIYMTNINPLPIAATEIRTLIKEHKNIQHLVTPNVQQYINNKQLYL